MPEEGSSKELDRLIFFSDAVFAIVMTLLILDIRVPDVAPREVPGLVFDLWPKILSYALRVHVIGLYWIGHHQSFRYVRSYDRTLLWLNLVFLLSISFIPFPTALLGEYGELRFSVIFYAASLGVARLLLALMWWYVVSGPIRTSDDLDRGLANYHFLRSLAIPAVFFLSIGIAFFSPDAAVVSWVLLVVVDAAAWRIWKKRNFGGVNSR